MLYFCRDEVCDSSEHRLFIGYTVDDQITLAIHLPMCFKT